jgi:DNA-binding response OmpR family regulator
MKKRILIVDDFPPNAESLELYLNLKGYEATCCFSASGALSLMACHKFDYMVIDYYLGNNATGLDLLMQDPDGC